MAASVSLVSSSLRFLKTLATVDKPLERGEGGEGRGERRNKFLLLLRLLRRQRIFVFPHSLRLSFLSADRRDPAGAKGEKKGREGGGGGGRSEKKKPRLRPGLINRVVARPKRLMKSPFPASQALARNRLRRWLNEKRRKEGGERKEKRRKRNTVWRRPASANCRGRGCARLVSILSSIFSDYDRSTVTHPACRRKEKEK